MTVMTDPLAYYGTHGAALFPIPAGQKNPTGIIESFARDFSRDPAQWAAWRAAHPNCNFGIVAGPSRIIIIDVDTKEGREAAWTLWCELCASWGIEVVMPHVQSARGGWHIYFIVPHDVDPAKLRQPDAIKKIINVRAGNGYTVAAGSYYDGSAKQEESGAYVLLSDAAPYPAPAALVAHCTRAEPNKSAVSKVGERDRGDVAALLQWLTERDAFSAYEDWLNAGMALKLEYGDDGLDLWELTFNDTVTPDVRATKWQSFSAEPAAGCVTLSTLLDRAHKLGWRGTVRKSAASMFSTVAQLAASAGASLSVPGAQPVTIGPGGFPMLAGQEMLADIGRPMLLEFLTATHDAPNAPIAQDCPKLPETMAGHGLYSAMQDCLARMFAMAEQPKFKPSRATDVLVVLNLLHQDVFAAACRRLVAMGHTLPDRKIKTRALGLSEEIERVTVTLDKWEYDARSGEIQSDNPDNVRVFLGVVGCEVRWNVWLHRMEIIGDRWSNGWSPIDDTAVSHLMTRAKRTKTRFKPSKEFFRDTLDSLAHDNPHDPVADYLASLQWDGRPRLGVWLTATCGVPCDPYHQAVGRNVIGGMVRRALEPGCKHDEVMILMGPQGTAKSTLCRILAQQDDWFSDSVSFDGTPQNIVPQLFGKLVVELAELDGMHRKEVQHIKAFITRQSDSVTLKYRAFASDHPRRCIFIGTSNEHNPLVDTTGNRRFLPVRVDRHINVEWLRANVVQLVAEAVHRHAAGESFAIPREVWGAAAVQQEEARGVSDIETMLTEWFAPTAFSASAYIAVADLAELCQLAGWRGIEGLRTQVMKRLGFRQVRPAIVGERTRVWLRGPEMLPREVERLPQYQIGKSQDGRPFVRLRMGTQRAAVGQS